MRSLELLLAALAIIGSLTLPMRGGGRLVAPICCAMAVFVFAFHAWFEGVHWQMIPVYAALLALGAQCLGLGSRARSRVGAAAALALCICGVAVCWALPIFRLPAPTGSLGIGTRTLDLVDQATGRELVVQLWYPAEKQGRIAPYVRRSEVKPFFTYESLVRTNSFQDAPVLRQATRFPVLIFGHMWSGRRTQDTFLAEEFASHGYVVVAVDHPGNTARMQLRNGTVTKGTMMQALSSEQAKSAFAVETLWNNELNTWTRDNEFILNSLTAADQDPSSWMFDRLDLSRVGAFGHSFGGAASLHLLGLDSRVKAAANLDGWTFGGLATRTAQPILILYSARAEQTAPAATTGQSVDDELDRDDEALVNQSLQRFGGYEAFVIGSQHLDFTDQTLVSPIPRLTYTGPIHGARVRQITRALLLAFFDKTLKGSGTMPEFPEVRRAHWTEAPVEHSAAH